nr:hypothetical protein [Amycolatopsis australiensis]
MDGEPGLAGTAHPGDRHDRPGGRAGPGQERGEPPQFRFPAAEVGGVGRQQAGTGRRCRRTRQLLAEDPVVRRGQLPAGIGAQFVAQVPAHAVEHAQRGGLPATGGQREHQPGVDDLVERVGLREPPQHRHHLARSAGFRGERVLHDGRGVFHRHGDDGRVRLQRPEPSTTAPRQSATAWANSARAASAWPSSRARRACFTSPRNTTRSCCSSGTART